LSRLLVLGGSPFQIPAIVHAARLGHHVITCDYLPHNPGHALAHESYNVSTTDRDGVLTLARERRVDGVLAFASDPAACTAAYVAAALGLPGLDVEAAAVLSNKAAFRTFLKGHGFKTPDFAAATTLPEARRAAAEIGLPLMMKPTDSSGSKGVTRVTSFDELPAAFAYAREYARDPRVILEQLVHRRGHQIAGDGLVVDGNFVFGCFGDEHFDDECCPHAPVGESFPGELTPDVRAELFRQLQRVFTLLGVRNLVFNLDAIVDSDGRLLILEIGPRAGGHCIPTVIKYHTGVDLVDIAIRQALAMPVPKAAYEGQPTGSHATWVIHSRREGTLQGLQVEDELTPYVTDIKLTAPLGSPVRRFSCSRDILGNLLLAFPSTAAMHDLLDRMNDLIRPVLQ
jgi:biotin carboxylase